ncbi:BLUF domain-containing protein [Sphingomonas sp. CFBP8993]|uniref:BLUF domain-containing protein n=1 Tax=Sphingomonas sp. CFBP8993 TaxID=3096526 RepID=UPI002A6B621E|nr:BLUF domain-containing protein [Sphingomonas sp. CFBP8993]MDY0958217.1 BLUF domain-containing protein [Sphingomonas sp. CFBP8993]
MIHVSSYRRIIYSSRPVGDDVRADHQAILAVSRRNNGMDGISGILWIGGDQYRQLLEGPVDSVVETLERIRHDPRHTDIVVLDDRMIDAPEFGEWAMAGLPGDRPDAAAERLRFLLRNAAPEIRQYFPVD